MIDEPIVLFFICIVAAIIILTVFFTAWGALMRKFKPDSGTDEIASFKNLPEKVNIHMSDGKMFENVSITGVTASTGEIPYEMQSFICIEGQDQKKKYIKASR